MDNLLLPYLNAENESERQQCLDDLLLVHAGPIVRKIMRRRLGFYVNSRGVNKLDQDAQDIYQEAITKVAQLLYDLRTSSSSSDIANFGQYVTRIAANVCVDFIRTKSPARTRLKDSLRDLFKRHKELVAWEFEGEILCGFAVWRNSARTFFSDPQSLEFNAKLEAFRAARFPHEDLTTAPLTQLLAELFDWIGGPVELDLLVGMLAILQDLREQPIESLDDERKLSWQTDFIVSAASSDSLVRAKELLGHLWQEVKKLPPEQRDAYCFRFEDDDGQDFFTLLLSYRIATLRELATEFDRPAEEIILLSARMPMDTDALVAELKTHRENVYKWRFRAIHRIRTELSSA